MKQTPEQAEVTESILERLAEVGPQFMAEHQKVVEATRRRKELRDELIALIREGRAVNVNMSQVAQAAGVSRQVLYTWPIKDD